MIRTVLGDIEKNEFGKTMCHEHFIIDLDKVRHDGISMIETVEEVPDTVISLTTGKKIFVKENRYEVRDLVVRYKQEVFNKIL